jgi:diguanylate cyclase (GGDEF)-like protein
MKYLKRLYFLIFISILLAISYLFLQTSQTQKILNKNVENILINEAKTFAYNIDEHLKKHIHNDPFAELKNNPKLREHLESSLAIPRSDAFKYIFVLYRDKHGAYRFLLDGSKDKARFNQRLEVNKREWNRAYQTQKPLILKQSKLDGLWITYLLPFVLNHQTKAIIAIDFSKELPQSIYNAIKPLNNIFTYIFIGIVFLILILLYQTFLSFKNKKESITDPLTGVYNRNFMRDLLKRINIDSYQIMMCDIDYFKQVNDNYGHKTGDEILIETAKILNTHIRPDDILIRYGGEEFLIFIKKTTSNEKLAYNIAQRMRQKVEETTFHTDNKVIKITLSIGITCQPEHFKSIPEAIKYADEMLYIAKRRGRNQIICESDIDLAKLSITSEKSINEVKEALEEQRLICVFQPIFDTQTQEILKYEALVRIKERDGAIVSPDRFLKKIMYTNIYNDMTKRVLENVFQHIRSKQVIITTNLNFSDILDNTIFQLILNELTNNKELAPWLIIELLEYEILAETTAIVKERLEKIRSFGVKIAIDDFGSGYSNYTMFQILPIDILKIDGELIRDLDKSKTSYIITESIVILAKELGIKTVAEFVHSKEVFKVVQQLGIDEAQGFYLAKPQEEIL